MFNSNISLYMEALTATPVRSRNLERFILATGRTALEYQEWASRVGRQMHINTLDRLVCAKLNLYTVAHLNQLPTELPEGLYEVADQDAFLIENSENPLELARLWKHFRNEAGMYVSAESVLAEYLNPFPKTSFERWGDPNNLDSVGKSWFRKSGTPLDVQVDEINEVAPIRVTLDDVIYFVMRWKLGAYQSPAAFQMKRIEERFKELTTFRIKEYYADHLIASATLSLPSLVEVPF